MITYPWFDVFSEKYYASDSMTARDKLWKARWRREETDVSHLWADQMFIATCYGAAAGKKRFVRDTVKELQSSFPNYDPCSRFDKSKIFFDLRLNEDIKEERLKMVDMLERFVRTHKKFSFSDSFSQYFGDVSYLDSFIL